MARVRSFTSDRMLVIENETVVDGLINEAGNLILFRRDGFTIDAGTVSGPKGDPGAGVSDVDVRYQASQFGEEPPAGAWTTNIPMVPDGYYLWTRTLTTYADPQDTETSFVTTTYSVVRNALPGADGTGIDLVITEYQVGSQGTVPPTGDWLPGIPSAPPGQFLWTRMITVYTDDTTSTAYSVAKQGADGQNGTDGGVGENGLTSYLHVAYARDSLGEEGFSTSDPSGRSYMGTYVDFELDDSTNPSTYVWVKIQGSTGVGVSSTSVSYQGGLSGTVTPTGTWTTTLPDVPEGEFQWTRTVMNFTDGASTTIYSVVKQGSKGDPGADGRGIIDMFEEYYLSTSSTVLTGGSWTDSRPAYMPGKFYWTRSTIEYTSGSPTTTTPICVSGTDGRAVVDVDVMYYLSTSATSLTDGSWVTEAPDWVSDKFIWTRTVTTYTTGDPTLTDPICVTGSQGLPGSDGTGIESIVVTYQGSVYGTAEPTGTWKTMVPEIPDGHYLWTRIVTTLSDASTTTAYSVVRQGMKGEDGADGTDGYDGRGILLVATSYQVGDSGAIAPTGTWDSDMPETPDGKYLWTRSTTTYTYGSPTVAYTVGKMGEPGPMGPPVYTWTQYADTESGSGMSDFPANKLYMGMAYNQTTSTPSTNPLDYKWTLIKGSDGTDGVDGVDGADGADAALLRISSSRGTSFKNSAISTVLTVTVFKGALQIVNIEGLWAEFGPASYLEWWWRRLDDTDFGVISSSDYRLGQSGFSLTISPDDVDEQTVFQCILHT